MKKEILITGGVGYIGSHCVISLIENNFTPIIIDNLTNSHLDIIKKLEIITKKKIIFYKLDLRNKKKLISIFDKHNFYAVIHCAGLKAVGESIKKSTLYFDNNIGSTISLLDCMREKKIFKLIFSSSATVYDENQPLPWIETGKTGNTKNPYGTSKYLIEKILMDLIKFDKRWNIRIARYFNPISIHASGLIKENPKSPPDNLIPQLIKVAQKKISKFKVYGNDYKTKDGTCIRDYIHVMDLADGHVAMLKMLNSKKCLEIYNFGSGKGYSVLEIISKFERQIGIPIPFEIITRRKGDVPVAYCDPKKALKDLNWKTKFNIDKALKDLKNVI